MFTSQAKTVRVNTRYFPEQQEYVKNAVEKSSKSDAPKTEGDIWREIVALGIAAHKKQK